MFTTIEVLSVNLLGQNSDAIFAATPDDLRVGGDAVREQTNDLLRLRITGIDPQVYLPPVHLADAGSLQIGLRVFTAATSGNAGARA